MSHVAITIPFACRDVSAYSNVATTSGTYGDITADAINGLYGMTSDRSAYILVFLNAPNIMREI